MNSSIHRLLFGLALCTPALAQNFVYDQPPAPNGGTLRASQLWIDPTGQNDSDNDAIAWEDFVLAQDTVLTHVRWWGESAPSLGFEISFFHQDPGTIAVQPDIVQAGSGPITQALITNFTQALVSGSLYVFEADLPEPVFCAANTRYFVSIVGRMPLSYTQWRWAQSYSGTSGTFWWQRGLHMYFMLADNRAVSLASAWGALVGTAFCPGTGNCPCGNDGQVGLGCDNSTGEGAVLVATGSASASADDLLLQTLSLPRNQSCLTFASASFTAGAPFFDGRRCLAGPISRFTVKNSGSSGVVSHGPGLSSYSMAHFYGANQFLAGRTLGFQTWYRDPSGPCARLTNVSSGRSVTFTP
ncbi:MAG: hypothetical protein IT454_06405 [Planctomycetes bacterium]|nr:hypothetical protein [Planctomycetota bacterium]